MTACVNRKHTKKVAAVVTASLVGALSLGVAPVAAMANEGIETLADETGSIARGEVEYAHNYKDGHKFTYTGDEQGLIPTVLKDENESGALSHDLRLCTKTNGAYVAGYYYFYVDLNGTDNVTALFGGKDVYYMDGTRKVPVSGKVVATSADNCMPSAVGKYAVVVGHFNGTSWDAIVSQTATFTISARSLDDAAIFQGEDPSDTVINYTGENGCDYVSAIIADMGVTVDGGRVLDPAEDFDVEIWNDGATAKIADGSTLTPGTKYVAKIKGTGAYSGEEKDVAFTYEKLDLSDAAIIGKIAVEGTDSAPTDAYTFTDIVTSVDGIDLSDLSNYVKAADYSYEFASNPSGGQTAEDDERGVYTYTITAGENDPYVKGTAEVQVMYVDYEAVVDFGNGYLDQDGDGTFQVDLNANNPVAFKTSGITVKYTDENSTVKWLSPDQFKITDLEGNPLTDADFAQPGTRYVKVYVEQWVTGADSKTQHLVGGYDIAKVVTSYRVTEAADVFFSFDGKNVESAVDAEYTGSNMVERMAFKVYAGDKILEQDKDYKVVFEAEDADGKRTEVEEIVDAGIYYVTVEGISYSGTAEFTLTVAPMEITSAAPVNDIVTNEATGDGYLMYTGEVLTPSYIFFKNGKQVEVPEGSYTISRYDGDEGGRDAELKDVDTYTAYFKTAEDVKNYDFNGCTATVKVTKDRVFNDVANDFWAAQDIYTANKKGWMNGYGGTKFFGPNDNIKRGDVAVVLYKMAGRPEIVDEGKYDENTGYDTGFGDVDGKMYYAEAILWAKQAGIVSGDEGTGMFRPEDSISRQELAKMLCVYAEKCNEDVSSDVDAVLGEYEDANTVSEWAEGYVAYLVSEGIMGNESPLRGTDPITRAEVATMVVRLSEVFDFGLIAR